MENGTMDPCPMWQTCQRHISESADTFNKLNTAMEVTKKTVPDIVHALQELNVSVKDLKDNLVGPATGRKQVPLSSHLVIVLSLAIALVLSQMPAGRFLSLSTSGITIHDQSPTSH